MNTKSNILRAELAYRIRTAAPADWNEFSNLWMAFNAIYGGEPELQKSQVELQTTKTHKIFMY